MLFSLLPQQSPLPATSPQISSHRKVVVLQFQPVPFNRLVRLAARAFYDDLPAPAGGGQQHAQGTAVVVLDALTRRDGQWVREDDLAASLRMQPKPLRRVLRYLEEDKIVLRDHRKEPAPAKPAAAAGVAEEGDEKERVKLHVKSYCCLDYAQACDAVRYRLHRMRKKIRDELTADSRATVQHYLCPDCGRRYSALDALRLLAEDFQSFRCEHCSGELVVEKAATIATDEAGDGGDDGSRARKRRRLEKLQDMQRRMEEQLEPLQAQIQRVEGLPAPEFMSLRSWQKENNVELGVLLHDADQSGTVSDSAPKVFPPWMVKLGMDQTGGKARLEGKSEEGEDDKKMNSNEEEEKQRILLEQEYAKAYYEALLKQQQLGANVKHEEEQQLGTNVKHENDQDVEEEAGIEWEDGDAGIEWEDGEN
ncbi:hypothetical protein CFC21_096550 [Triticum aestivum]|uniref:HTH TFE/IIEalpha-type domain-containing protein n=2 Tax=Triticum aestivum TaxID=4565 RepID=A0A9R1LSJ3_WHEAT|nr:hypothetical protein CFC21_096550 [Triticum aestivum]